MGEMQLLTIVVPIDLRDDVIDALSGCACISGFNMSAIAGYSREHSQYDLREQVEGCRDLSQFDVMHESRHQDELLACLRGAFTSTKGRYWITAIGEHGHL
ncbi:Uncharacterised protein [Halioglobus japonicus]|nr:Uncharacterised protein [Halioglobus japonicus]